MTNWYQIRRYVFLIVGVGLIWQICAVMIHDVRTLPGIDYIFFRSLPSLSAFEGGSEGNYTVALWLIVRHSAITIFRILIGLTTGCLLGIIIGMSLHFFRQIRHSGIWLLVITRSVPLFALIPLFLYWFGGRESSVYAYISFAVAVIVATNTYEALCNVPPHFVLAAKLLGANRRQIFKTVHFYAIQPEMLAAFRNVVGLSWAFSLGAEYLSSSNGLGYLVYQSYLYSDMGKLILFALIYGCYGIISYKLLQNLIYNLVKWRDVNTLS